jgi:predicted amino acid dehydrogenase
MTRYITATVLVGRLIEEHGSLFLQGENLALLVKQLAACDRETAILEYEKRQLESANRSLRLQIQQRNIEIDRLRAGALRMSRT